MLHTEMGVMATPGWRHWPAGLGTKLMHGGAAAVVATTLMGMLNFTEDDRYQAAKAFARTNPLVVAEVGQVKSLNTSRTLSVQLANVLSDDTVYQFRVCGAKGSLNVAVRVRPEGKPSSHRLLIDR